MAEQVNGQPQAIPSVVVDFPHIGESFTMKPKVFKSGSHGWYWQGKTEIHGVRCQIQLQAVAIGSKPQEVNESTQSPARPLEAPETSSEQKPTKRPSRTPKALFQGP